MKFVNSDWQKFLPELESKSIDLILTHPPFDVLDVARDELGDVDMKKISEEFYRALQGEGKILIFCSIQQIPKWTIVLSTSGLKVLPIPIFVTHKNTSNFIIYLYSVKKSTTGGSTIQCRSQHIIVAYKQGDEGFTYNWKVILFILNNREIKNSLMVKCQEMEMSLKIIFLQRILSQEKMEKESDKKKNLLIF